MPRRRPEGGDYAHNRLNHDDNAHAHLRASLLGPSLSIPLVRGSLVLGTWQQVVLIDFDDRPRERGGARPDHGLRPVRRRRRSLLGFPAQGKDRASRALSGAALARYTPLPAPGAERLPGKL